MCYQNTHIKEHEDLSPFITALTKHPLLKSTSPLLCIITQHDIEKFQNKFHDFELACKAINAVIPSFPIPQAKKKDYPFLNLLENINSFTKARDFNDQTFIDLIDKWFPQSSKIFEGLRKELLAAITTKNKQLASDREKYREDLYPHQVRIMDQIVHTQDKGNLEKIQLEINQYFPDNISSIKDLRTTLLEAYSRQLQVISETQVKSVESKKEPIKETKKPLIPSPQPQVANDVQPLLKIEEKKDDVIPNQNQPELVKQDQVKQNKTSEDNPVPSSKIPTRKRIAFLTGLCLLCYFLWCNKANTQGWLI
jgi:hypothetical protein